MNTFSPLSAMNVPPAAASAEHGPAAGSHRGGAVGQSPGRRGSKGKIRRSSFGRPGGHRGSFTLKDLLGGSGNGGGAADALFDLNEAPKQTKTTGGHSESGGCLGGKIKSASAPQKKIKSLFNVSSVLGKSKNKFKFADEQHDGGDEYHGSSKGKGAHGELLSPETESAGGGPSCAKGGGGLGHGGIYALGKSTRRSFGKGGKSIGNLKSMSGDDKTLTDLVGRQSWRKVRSRLRTDDGRGEAAASLLSVRHGWDAPLVGGDAFEYGTDTNPATISSPAADSSPVSDSARQNDARQNRNGGKKDEREGNALHLALRHRAPLSVLAALTEICPSLTVEPDVPRGRTALHVAASPEARRLYHGGGDGDVVGLILDSNPGAVWARDRKGRLPIHLACMAEEDDPEESNGPAAGDDDSPPPPKKEETRDFDGLNGQSTAEWVDTIEAMLRRSEVDLESVLVLLSRAPSAVLAEDDRGRIPAECVLEVAASADGDDRERMEVLQGLIEEGEREWRWRRDRRQQQQANSSLVVRGDVPQEPNQLEDEDNSVEEEYRRWLARRSPLYLEAVEEYRRWAAAQNEEGKDGTNGKSLTRHRTNRAVPVFEDVEEGASREVCCVDNLDDNENEERKEVKELPPVPHVVVLDPDCNDEWVEDELQAEFEG